MEIKDSSPTQPIQIPQTEEGRYGLLKPRVRGTAKNISPSSSSSPDSTPPHPGKSLGRTRVTTTPGDYADTVAEIFKKRNSEKTDKQNKETV